METYVTYKLNEDTIIRLQNAIREGLINVYDESLKIPLEICLSSLSFKPGIYYSIEGSNKWML